MSEKELLYSRVKWLSTSHLNYEGVWPSEVLESLDQLCQEYRDLEAMDRAIQTWETESWNAE